MTPLLDLSRSVLWHWKTFPIILPPPITLQADQNQGQPNINIQIFIATWNTYLQKITKLLFQARCVAKRPSTSEICSSNPTLTNWKQCPLIQRALQRNSIRLNWKVFAERENFRLELIQCKADWAALMIFANFRSTVYSSAARNTPGGWAMCFRRARIEPLRLFTMIFLML